jgi:hypothetical protein
MIDVAAAGVLPLMSIRRLLFYGVYYSTEFIYSTEIIILRSLFILRSLLFYGVYGVYLFYGVYYSTEFILRRLFSVDTEFIVRQRPQVCPEVGRADRAAVSNSIRSVKVNDSWALLVLFR